MPSQDTEPPSHSTRSHSKASLVSETAQTSPRSVNSGITEDYRPSPKPSASRSRLSFGSSRLSRFLSPSESSSSRRGSLSLNSLRGSPGPSDTGKLNDLRSEISSNSSASQIRSTVRGLAKRFDKVAISSSVGSLMDRLSPAPQEIKDTSVDELDRRGRKYEVVLQAALGISEQLQVKFFDKHRDAIKNDMRAQNLEIQNARIRTLDHQMFITVAFYGDSGIGKSSLINALLDSQCITPTSDGIPCTTIPIKFKARDRSQNMRKNYTVIADVLTDEEWLPVAKRFLEDLHQSSPDTKAEIAKDILQSLFDLPEDGTPITLEMIEKLPLNCAESTRFNKRFSTQELSELRGRVENLNAFYWPALKRITVYMDSPVLNTGVVLVDLPRSGNINPTKREIVNSYLKSCNTVFIVSNAFPAMDNFNLLLSDSIVKPIARRAQLDGSSKISFILTQTDKITESANIPNSHKEAIQQYISETRQQFSDSSQSQLREAEVFCVSSLEYQYQHKRFVRPNTKPCLSIDDSEIPALRRFIQTKGLQQREFIVRTLVDGNIKIFINSVQGWCENKEFAPPETHNFDELEKGFYEVVATHGWELLADSVGGFKGGIDKVIEQALVEAKEVTVEWAKYKHNTFKAACNKKGDREENLTYTLHLNEDLAAPIRNQIAGPWETSFYLQPQILRGLTNFACQKIYGRKAKHSPGSMFSTLNNTFNSDSVKDIGYDLENLRLQIDDVVITQEKTWNDSLDKIFERIFIFKNEPLVREKMVPTYEKCVNIGGTGAKAARDAVVKDAVPRIMKRHYSELCGATFQELDQLVISIKNGLTVQLGEILGTVKFNHFSTPEMIMTTTDLNMIKSELLGISKFMGELEERVKELRVSGPCE